MILILIKMLLQSENIDVSDDRKQSEPEEQDDANGGARTIREESASRNVSESKQSMNELNRVRYETRIDYQQTLRLPSLLKANYLRLKSDINNDEARGFMEKHMKDNNGMMKYWYLHNYNSMEKVKFDKQNTRLIYQLQIQFFKQSTMYKIEKLRHLNLNTLNDKTNADVAHHRGPSNSPNDMNRATSWHQL